MLTITHPKLVPRVVLQNCQTATFQKSASKIWTSFTIRKKETDQIDAKNTAYPFKGAISSRVLQ